MRKRKIREIKLTYGERKNRSQPPNEREETKVKVIFSKEITLKKEK